MKKRCIFALMAMLVMSLVIFTACSSDDEDGGGFNGYYVSTSTRTNGDVKFRNVVKIEGNNLYKGFICNKIYEYGGNDMRACSWYSGWYIVPNTDSDLWSTTSFVYTEGIIVCTNGDIYTVSNGKLIGSSEIYEKAN